LFRSIYNGVAIYETIVIIEILRTPFLLEVEKQRIERGKQSFEGLTDYEKGLLGELTDV
jgi:hypothetical protein